MSRRSTLTLDDDVAAGLEKATRTTGRPFRAVVNDALRRGLADAESEKAERFVVKPFDLGLREGIDIDSISDLLERIEGPLHR